MPKHRFKTVFYSTLFFTLLLILNLSIQAQVAGTTSNVLVITEAKKFSFNNEFLDWNSLSRIIIELQRQNQSRKKSNQPDDPNALHIQVYFHPGLDFSDIQETVTFLNNYQVKYTLTSSSRPASELASQPPKRPEQVKKTEPVVDPTPAKAPTDKKPAKEEDIKNRPY